MRAAALPALALLLLSTQPVSAQPGGTDPVPEAPAPAPTDPAPAEPAPVPVAADPTLAAYEAAMRAMIAGDFAAAAAGFDRVAAESTDAERRAASRELARLARAYVDGGLHLSTGVDARVLAEHAEDRRSGGRISFVATNTLWALYAGVVVGDLLDLEDPRAWAGTLFAATGVGLLGSYTATRDAKMTAAMAGGYRFGLLIGVGNALLLGGPLGLYDSETETSERVQTAVFLSGSALALAGLVYGDQASPTVGEISFAETVSLLGIASTWLGVAIVSPDDLDGDTALTLTAAGLDVSATAGLVAGRKLEWSSGRSRLASLGALLGGLGGVAAGVILAGSDDGDSEGRTIAALTLAGMWGGFGLTAHLTRGMRPDRGHQAPASQLSFAPIVTDHGAGLSVARRW